jgi:hypothetical protein
VTDITAYLRIVTSFVAVDIQILLLHIKCMGKHTTCLQTKVNNREPLKISTGVTVILLYHDAIAPVGQGLVIIEDSWSHSDTPNSVGLLWTSDQLVANTSTWQHTTLTTDKYPRPQWDSNPRSQQVSGHRPLTCWDRVFESHCGHGYLSVVSVVCCQVEVFATSWSLVQRSPTDFGASLCVI